MGSPLKALKHFLENLDHYRDRIVLFLVGRWWPTAITPNQLSWLRIAISLTIFFLLFFTQTENKALIVWLFVIGAITDMLDGSLARGRNLVTKFGTMLDPLADRLLLVPIALYSLWRASPLLLWALIAVEVLNGLSSIYGHSKKVSVESNIFGKTKMVLQALAFFAILAYWPAAPNGFFIGVLWVSFILTFMSIFARLDEITERTSHA